MPTRLSSIKKHLGGATEKHVDEAAAALPKHEAQMLPPDWKDRLNAAGFNWSTILAAIIQGAPFVLDLLSKLAPAAPGKK